MSDQPDYTPLEREIADEVLPVLQLALETKTGGIVVHFAEWIADMPHEQRDSLLKSMAEAIEGQRTVFAFDAGDVGDMPSVIQH